MDYKLTKMVAQMGDCTQRYVAVHERNYMNKKNQFYAAQRQTYNKIVHCPHGLDPNCACVQNFSVNKNVPLTEKQAKVGVASFLRSEIERTESIDPRYRPLTKIIKSRKDELDKYISDYETQFGSLLTDDLFEKDGSIAHLRKLPSQIQAQQLDICQLGTPFRKIDVIQNASSVLCANDQYMLIHNASHLCLINAQMKTVRQTEWTLGSIEDACWNTKKKQIFLIVSRDHCVYKVDPETLSYESILEGRPYRSCTSAPKILYLTIYGVSQILAHPFDNLHTPKPVFTCPNSKRMCIEGICYHDSRLAVIMNTRNEIPPYVEILSTTTYECLFSITIQQAMGYHICGISSLGSSGWLVKDSSGYHFFHITEKNVLRVTSDYDYGHPYNAIRFGASYLAVVTNTNINLHKLKFVKPEELTPSAKVFGLFNST